MTQRHDVIFDFFILTGKSIKAAWTNDIMAFFKKLLGGKSAKDTACNLAKQVGLDPKGG